MAVLGSGNSNGGCSLLHAAGIGYGASLALDLPVRVRLLDKQSKRTLDDPDGLLEQVLIAWKNAGHPVPEGELHWSVKSEIPPRQGLKSSSAVSVAAIKALCDATGLELENADIIDIAAAAQLSAGVSITGSYDDSWAALEGGWKLVDANAEDARSGLLLESEGPSSEDWTVILVCRGDREKRPELEDFTSHQQAFAQALNALQEGKELVALTWNGRGVVGALNDPIGRRLTNDAFVNGGRAAGISGSGPAIVIFASAVSRPTIERIKKWYSKYDSMEVIETKVINADFSSMDE
ncbi:MAG: shikimate kinase [Euryarchaeota archaeon]|nr:shikimate kinase [Euryarchaeota archaeon]|tara:strand:- start:5080 stop:5961 length:882 start_codon:yes stop_codon:yes gene_type:complete